jgi:DNA-binding NtrC family response regulator
MRPSVLLVDDEVRLGEVVGAALQARDFDTLLASSVSDALNIVHSERVDVIVSDMRMRGQSGRELLAVVKRSTSSRKAPSTTSPSPSRSTIWWPQSIAR